MPLSVIMVVTPVTVSPWISAQLTGALPRYLGSREAWTFTVPMRGISSTSWLRIWPKAAVTHRSGANCRRGSTPSTRVLTGWNTGILWAMAHCLTGQKVIFLPRPLGLSGWQKTPATS